MNTRNLPTSALLVLLGAGATLFIGAFARFDSAGAVHASAEVLPVVPPMTQDDPPAEVAAEPPLPANLSPGLSELIKLAQAHVDESVILTYIKNSHQVFAPTADQILYLSDLGLSQVVIGALVGSAPPAAIPQAPPAIAAPPALVSASPPPAVAQTEADADANASASPFYSDLAPYGSWVQQPDYGLVWQPTVETINSEWTPYVDAGQWLYSDSGWYWQSDYTWGWAAFHYGRWVNIPHRGWVWQPGDIWAPAWVAWRSSSSYIGWAALPPGTGLNVLAQLTYHSKPIGSNSTLGLPATAYTFVNVSNLTSRNLPRRALPAHRIYSLVESSSVLQSYAIVNNRIFNGGASPEAVGSARRKPVTQVALRAVTSPDAAGLALDRKSLAIYVPTAASHATPTATDNPPREEADAPSENNAAETPVVPVASSVNERPVQLPPLRYSPPSRGTAPMVRRHAGEMVMASSPVSAPSPAPGPNVWPRGTVTPGVERPATSAPRFEGVNAPARPPEPPHVAAESHPEPVAPARVAPAPAASSSKSGKS